MKNILNVDIIQEVVTSLIKGKCLRYMFLSLICLFALKNGRLSKKSVQLEEHCIAPTTYTRKRNFMQTIKRS